MTAQKTTSAWKKTALVFLGLFFSLVLIEAGLRLGGFVLLSIQEYENLQAIKQKETYRILCLGESTTQGQYPHLLEEILNKSNVGVRFSVIDKGRVGTNTIAILGRVESYLAKYHSDMVVAMMGINDGGTHIPLETATASKGALFIRSFRTYKLFRLLGLHLLAKAKEMGFYKSKEISPESISLESSLKKMIELNPKNDDAYVGLGRFYLLQGKFPQAEDSFKKAVEINPKNANACTELGWIYKEQDKFLQAVDLFKKAIELNPKNTTALVELGRLYRDQGEFSGQAEDSFRKAIEINPEMDYVYSELGIFYRLQSKFAQDEDLCKQAIKINPGNVLAFFELVGLYRTQNKLSEADKFLKKAAAFNPTNEHVLGAISLLYEEMGKPELAKEYAEKAARLRSRDGAAVTVNSYRKLKEILDKKKIQLVCAQYPVRGVGPLKRIFEKDEGIIFVDNERVFKNALKNGKYKDYFIDMFGGDFGHCTPKGNELLAQNIAEVILREVFHQK